MTDKDKSHRHFDQREKQRSSSLVVLTMADLRFAPIHIIESAMLDNNYAGHIYYPHLNALLRDSA